MFKNKYLYVVVPHRGVTIGKSRLGAVLDDAARGELNRWLLLRTLRVLDAWLGDAQHCVVVSPCADTLALAQHAGAATLKDGAPGLNAALAQAADHAARSGARELLILPCDLPRLESAALREMSVLAEAGAEVVIAPDRHGSGSNALWVPAAMRRFAFGEMSLARHLAMAKDDGLRAALCRHPALAFDLDTPQDLADWRRSGVAMPPLRGLAAPAGNVAHRQQQTHFTGVAGVFEQV